MLKAENISFQVKKRKLLENISAIFHAGKINLIIGPNGAGKSTLIKILSGQINPSRGNVFYSDTNLRNIPVSELARQRAVLSQDIDLVFPMTVNDLVMMGRYPFFSGTPTKTDKQICEETISFFDLQKLKYRNYITLSGGEKQRVHFARVAAQIWNPDNHKCHYLILDEPLTFLDVFYQFDFMKKITTLVKKHNWVVVGVVHDLNLAGKYADHITLLHQGKILEDGSKETVLTKENILNAYGLPASVVHENNTVRIHF